VRVELGVGRRPARFLHSLIDLPASPGVGKDQAHGSNVQNRLFVGSLASGSINRTLSKALIKLAPEDLEFTEIPIGDLPLYSYDYDAEFPAEGRALKEAIEGSDGILFVSPEYNRSIPGALKNAIDWGSRPWGANSFARKPAGIIGASPGSIGTAVMQSSMRAGVELSGRPAAERPGGLRQVRPRGFRGRR
jgi:chromate reductase